MDVYRHKCDFVPVCACLYVCSFRMRIQDSSASPGAQAVATLRFVRSGADETPVTDPLLATRIFRTSSSTWTWYHQNITVSAGSLVRAARLTLNTQLAPAATTDAVANFDSFCFRFFVSVTGTCNQVSVIIFLTRTGQEVKWAIEFFEVRRLLRARPHYGKSQKSLDRLLLLPWWFRREWEVWAGNVKIENLPERWFLALRFLLTVSGVSNEHEVVSCLWNLFRFATAQEMNVTTRKVSVDKRSWLQPKICCSVTRFLIKQHPFDVKFCQSSSKKLAGKHNFNIFCNYEAIYWLFINLSFTPQACATQHNWWCSRM